MAATPSPGLQGGQEKKAAWSPLPGGRVSLGHSRGQAQGGPAAQPQATLPLVTHLELQREAFLLSPCTLF